MSILGTFVRNGVRLRVGGRVTKAGEAAERHFDALVVAHLQSIGAVPSGERYGHEWAVQTRLGRLRIGTRGHYIVQIFDEYERAKMKGPSGHWKWNFHYDLGAAEDEVESWKRQLAPWLVSP